MSADKTDKQSGTLKSAVSSIQKKFGKGSVMLLSQTAPVEQVEAISTGSLALDFILGVGGLPRGRIVEIYGAESSGKSTLALSIIAQAQKRGGMAAFVDAEHALDPAYAAVIGVDHGSLLLSQPDSAEQALEIVETLVRSGDLDVVVVDSVAALVPQAEAEGQMGEFQIGSQARLMSQALRKLTSAIYKTNTVVIFINQLRQKVGVMYGNPEVTSGGQALKYYSSVRIDLRRRETLKEGTNMVGIRVRARIVKNKVAPPFKSTEFDVAFGKGIVRETEVLGIGVETGVIQRSGASYSWEGTKLGSGKEAAQAHLVANPAMAESIESAIVAHLKGGGAPAAQPDSPAE